MKIRYAYDGSALGFSRRYHISRNFDFMITKSWLFDLLEESGFGRPPLSKAPPPTMVAKCWKDGSNLASSWLLERPVPFACRYLR